MTRGLVQLIGEESKQDLQVEQGRQNLEIIGIVMGLSDLWAQHLPPREKDMGLPLAAAQPALLPIAEPLGYENCWRKNEELKKTPKTKKTNSNQKKET